MKDFACDICGKRVKDEYELSAFTPAYRIEGVEHGCKSCMADCEKHNTKLEELTKRWSQNWMRVFIKNLRDYRRPS